MTPSSAAAAASASVCRLAGDFGTVLNSRLQDFAVEYSRKRPRTERTKMPVIGRLDGQVDEVIIRPISDRRRGEDPPADAADEATARAHRDTHAHAPPAANQTPPAVESSADADELPVWLL